MWVFDFSASQPEKTCKLLILVLDIACQIRRAALHSGVRPNNVRVRGSEGHVVIPLVHTVLWFVEWPAVWWLRVSGQ